MKSGAEAPDEVVAGSEGEQVEGAAMKSGAEAPDEAVR